MESTALILIALTLLMLTVVVIILSFIIYRLFFSKQHNNRNKVELRESLPVSDSHLDPKINERLKEIHQNKSKYFDIFCQNHKKEPGEVTCGICGLHFCPSCVKPYKSLHFCKNHFPVIMKNEWTEVFTIEASAESPHEGVNLYETKKSLFENKNIPTYIETHYKINVDQNNIETYFVLFSIKSDVDEVKSFLKFKQ
jgi:hypothetical protein